VLNPIQVLMKPIKHKVEKLLRVLLLKIIELKILINY
jgi:hypothetical protein